ncbi:hypothetical protein ACHAWF_006612 [Thalassiosira exigua]
MMLYVRSVMDDLCILQGAASLLYEDNDACAAIGNAQKPTTRTRHFDIRYCSLCEWIDRDLVLLDRIDTSQNMSDHFTKQLSPVLFARHTDYVMGRIPPVYSPCFPGFRAALEINTRHPPRDTPHWTSRRPTLQQLPRHDFRHTGPKSWISCGRDACAGRRPVGVPLIGSTSIWDIEVWGGVVDRSRSHVPYI